MSSQLIRPTFRRCLPSSLLSAFGIWTFRIKLSPTQLSSHPDRLCLLVSHLSNVVSHPVLLIVLESLMVRRLNPGTSHGQWLSYIKHTNRYLFRIYLWRHNLYQTLSYIISVLWRKYSQRKVDNDCSALRRRSVSVPYHLSDNPLKVLEFYLCRLRLQDIIANTTVIVGSLDLQTAGDSNKFIIDQIAVHPLYDPTGSPWSLIIFIHTYLIKF